jgi:hypothetical protein
MFEIIYIMSNLLMQMCLFYFALGMYSVADKQIKIQDEWGLLES